MLLIDCRETARLVRLFHGDIYFGYLISMKPPIGRVSGINEDRSVLYLQTPHLMPRVYIWLVLVKFFLACFNARFGNLFLTHFR